MTHDTEFSDLLHAVAQKSLQIINDIQEKPVQLSGLVEQYIDLTKHFQNVIAVILKNPEQIWGMQMAYWQDALIWRKLNLTLAGRHTHAYS